MTVRQKAQLTWCDSNYSATHFNGTLIYGYVFFNVGRKKSLPEESKHGRQGSCSEMYGHLRVNGFESREVLYSQSLSTHLYKNVFKQ